MSRLPGCRSLGPRGDRNTLLKWEGVDDYPFLEPACTRVESAVWAALQKGEFLTDAAAVAGTNRWRALQWLREAGGVRPRRGRDLKGRCLSFAEREEIALGRAGGQSVRAIAARLGPSPSTISRELARNAG